MMDHKSPEAFRTISEVADWLGVPTHVLRFWESRFAQVKPVKRAGGRRYYRPADMELLGGIRKLLHEDGMTIRGVQKLLREQGVKHVAAMSPPLDTGSEDIVDSNVVDLSEARESVAEPENEAAPEPEPEAEEPAAESPSLAEEKWAELIGGAAPTPDAETEPAAPVADAEQAAEPEAAEAESEAADAAPETAAEADDSAHGDGEPDPFVLTDPNPTPGAAEIGDALPDPDAADFLAHEAPPETADGDGGPFETAEADSAAAASDETEADDAMSSPEALEFAAHDGEPETTETETGEETPSEATEAELDLGDLATLDGADEAAVAAPPEGETGVDAAGIGPDPDDDAYAPDAPLMAVRLRDARARRARLNVARLGALADRLEELAGRMKGDGGPHRPL